MKQQPIWLEGLAAAPAVPETPLSHVDVLIVGSGYTGLNAALETARGGRMTMVLDTGDPGFGCSTRNGGQVSTSIKPSLEKLTRAFGQDKARTIRAEGRAALEWIKDRVSSEGIDCDFLRSGRYHAAHTPGHYEALVRDAETMQRDEAMRFHAVPRGEQLSELGSDGYYGGVVFPDHASLQPAKYHRGLLRRAIEAGVHVCGHCKVLKFDRTSSGFSVLTGKGTVTARDVIVATNGYSGGLTPWLQRRVIPIGSSVIATEELPAAVMDRLFPTNRIASDTCKVVYYYRASPDRKRVVFGGRVAAREIDPERSAPRLFESMCRIFPELEAYGVSHSWSGTVAYTFDELPHTGRHDGVYFAMGYCGSGVSLASYLGMRTGQKVLGLKEGETAFDALPFPGRAYYQGKPWFLPAVVAWYRWVDNIQRNRAALG